MKHYESVIGHGYTFEVKKQDGKIQDVLDEICEDLDMDRKRSVYVEITEGDVSWDNEVKIQIPINIFKKMVKDFENR